MIKLRRIIFAGAKDLGEKVALGPDDAVDRLRGRAADGANRERFGALLGNAIVAFGCSLGL